jgi:hypothetical protein
MRFALAAVLLATVAGCPSQTSSSGDDGYYPIGGGGGGGEEPGCRMDSDCGDEVCARDGECLPAADVWHVAVTWTIAGAPASNTSCEQEPNLEIQFSANDEYGDGVGFAPVPCNEGKFSVDKMPIRFEDVTLWNEDSESGGASGTFDGSGNVSLDLPSR